MLRVTAWMVSPIVGDPPHIDALLEFEMAQRHGVACKLRRDLPAPPESAIHIPMLRRRIGGRSVACCSSPIVDLHRSSREHFTKRLAVEHTDLLSANERRVVATGNGTYKSYRLPIDLIVCRRVVWFCEADRRPLLKLLKSVTAIGPKRSHGFGRIARWEADHVDGSFWWFADSPTGRVLMRPLPDGDHLPADLTGYRRDFGACSPPYWHPDRYGEIVVPC